MTTAASTKGRTVGIAVQTSLTNQPTTFDEIRTHEAVTIPTEESLSEAQPNLGHENALDWSDKPITFEGVRENGMTIPVAFRRGVTTGKPPIAKFAESGGCATYQSGNDSISAYTDTENWTYLTGAGGDEFALAHAVELDSGIYYPILEISMDETPSVVVPVMGLPSASSISNVAQSMYLITPQTGPVDNSKLLAAKVNTRGSHTTTADLAWAMYGCALGTFGDIVIEPQGQLTMAPTFHVADVDQLSDSLAAETFIDTTYLQRNQGNFRFEFEDYSAAGQIPHACLSLLKATVTLGHTTMPIPGDGCTDSLNSIQGYIASTPEQPKVVLELLMDKTYWDTFKTVGNTDKHIGFVWGTDNLNVPAYAIWMPRCHQIASPVADIISEEYMKVTVTYGASKPDWTGLTDGNNVRQSSPWFMAIHSENT
jgi:hypothetical protein